MQKKAVIVLGGGLTIFKQNNQCHYIPSDQVKLRLDKAIQLYENDKVDYIITTGNYSKRVEIENSITGPKTEAEVSRKYLLENYTQNTSNKQFNDFILFENKSFDTLGNAWFAKKECLEPHQITRCYIITSDFHIERSKLIFKWVLGDKYKLDTISIPTHFTGKSQREKLEKIFTNYFNQWLIPSIKAGDDKAIEQYFYNEHLIYSMTERSEALFKACMETAAITAGY